MSSTVRTGIVVAGLVLLAGCGGKPEPDAAAVENADAMAREHAEDSTAASPAVDLSPKRAVESTELPYAEVGDELIYGYFASPADMVEPLSAVLVIHEWWGLNDNIREMADRLAGEGYIVLAVDLFGGRVAENPADARDLMLGVSTNPDRALANLENAIDFLRNGAFAPSVATLGWCFGGGWSLNAAAAFADEVDASVVYYGQVTDRPDRLEPIQSPVIGFFGGQDRGIKVEDVRSFEAAMKELGKDITVHVYDDAGHAFANPTGDRYQAAAAEDAWQKTLDFLAARLPAPAD